MTVLEFIKQNNYNILCCEEDASERSITGVYVCDMLSHAMANIKDGNVWVTVHTNINIAAVASLTNAACVIIPENIKADELTIKKAAEQGVIIVSAPHSAYDICTRYYTQTSGGLK